jgi:hypothetical protein
MPDQGTMNQPLLGEPLPSALAEIGAAGGSQGYITVGQLQTTTPDQALKVLSAQGVKTLGSLVVLVRLWQHASSSRRESSSDKKGRSSWACCKADSRVL